MARRGFGSLVLAVLVGAAAGVLGQALAGVYYSAELEATYRIVSRSDAGTLEKKNNQPVALSLSGPDRLRTPQGLELRPVRDGGDRVTGLTLNAGRVRDVAFTKR